MAPAVAPAVGADAIVSTRELKAALILRLIDFIEWPAGQPGTPFQLCVVADRPLADALEASAKALRVGGLPVEVVYQSSLQNLSACRLLFIGTYDERKTRRFLEQHSSSPILTVGETGEFLLAGGVLRISIEMGKVQLELNQAAATNTRLQISSRLMRLAKVVDKLPAPGRAQ